MEVVGVMDCTCEADCVKGLGGVVKIDKGVSAFGLRSGNVAVEGVEITVWAGARIQEGREEERLWEVGFTKRNIDGWKCQGDGNGNGWLAGLGEKFKMSVLQTRVHSVGTEVGRFGADFL